jgi:DNA-binding MarR family transcriptional regulator
MAKGAQKFDAKEAFLAFAEWRLRIQFAQSSRKSVLFFRRSRDHSILWMLVMRGYYNGAPPSVRECQEKATCSRPTTRKLLSDAQARGFIEIRPAADDSRKRLVYPSKRAVEEYESMVMGYLSLWETLGLERKSGRSA